MSADSKMAGAVLPAILHRQVAQLLGAKVVQAIAVTAGMTLARRWVVEFEDGRRAFLKAAGNSATAQWLRREYNVYQNLKSPHLPELIGWSDQPPGPFLLLEDLSKAHWPPPWTSRQISSALEAIRAVHRWKINAALPALESQFSKLDHWQRIAADPSQFLALRLCSPQWLQRSLPDLIAAEKLVTLNGTDLVHGDFKSGNICFEGNRIILLDWNWAARGNGLLDIANWLPGLAHETGQLPESILPDQPSLAAFVAGSLAYWGTQPMPAEVPQLRESQLQRLKHAFDWACRQLSLPPH